MASSIPQHINTIFMTIKNFATFGLFFEGKLIDSGSIQHLENEAIRTIMSGQAESLHISVINTDDDSVSEGMSVLSYRQINDTIVIANMLLDDNEAQAVHID